MNLDKPSATAYLIARSIILSSHNELVRPLIPTHAVEICARFVACDSRLMSYLLGWQPFRFLARGLERMTVPGIFLHYILRKRFLEEIARREIERGCRQVVVIGAGFDTLALRLSSDYPMVNFLEIDHPATQRVKVRSRDCPPRHNLFFRALDLTRIDEQSNLLPAITRTQEQRTLFIAEGLLMYLAPQEIDRLLSAIRLQSARGSLLACTLMMKTDEMNRIAFQNSSSLVDFWLRLRGEQFRSGLERRRAADFFSQRGFALDETADHDTLRGLYLTTPSLARLPLARGEEICLATRV
jgi:methyltransferase, putative, TIGR00027 family